MAWDLSCPDWRDRIRAGRGMVPELPLDAKMADRAVRVFDRLRLADVPGTPTLGEAAGDWFRDIVRALFGSWDPEAKERAIREIFVLVPKKSSKTSYSAGMMLTALILNERPNGKFLLVAPTQDVTELAFGQASGAIDLDPYLTKRMKVQAHLKRITDTTNGATLEVMSFDPQVLTGQKPTGFLVDELHVMSASAKAASAVGQLRGGMIAQPEAFGVFITTQSEKPPAGVFRAELNRARSIRDGKATGPLLPVLYEFPEDIATKAERWQDPTNWHMVTPNAGRSITIPRLVDEFKTANQLGAEEVVRWSSQHLNIEVGIGLTSDRWRGADHWLAATEPGLDMASLLERSEVVTAGIDGGGLDDLLSLALIGRERVTRRWLVWGQSWVHQGVLTLRKSEAPKLRDFEAAGELIIVDDMEDAFSQVAELVAAVNDVGILAHVGLDPMGVGMIVDAMAERGVGGDRVVAVSQGWTLNGAIKTTEVKLASGAMVHAGQAVMAWAVGNAKAEPKGNAVTINKQTSGTGKIDPIMAVYDAVALMSRNPEAMAASIYERPEAYEAVYGAAEQEQSEAWDPEIIKDMRHPMFAEHKRRFEAWQDARADQDAW